MSDKRSAWPETVPNLVTWCCYQGWGYVLPKVSLLEAVPNLATWCLYLGVCLTTGQPEDVATRREGVHLTKGQPDPKADQLSSWPEVVTLLTTRWLYQEVHLIKGQPDLKANQMWSWPEVVQLLATRCLYWGVHLTKGQHDPKIWEKMSTWPEASSMGGSIWLKYKKDMWKFGNLLCISCFASQVFMKDQ